MKFTIDRETWLRGEGSDESYLLRDEDGKKCCLGFFALSCGLTEEAISNIATPEDVGDSSGEKMLTHNLWGKDGVFLFDPKQFPSCGTLSPMCSNLMETNDDQYISDSEREERLILLFAKAGVEVEFSGE